MANNEETVRLKLDVDSSSVGAASQTVKVATSDVYEFAQSITHVSGETYEFADDAHFLSIVLADQDSATKRLASSNDAAAKSLDKLAKSAEHAKSGAVGFGQSMLQSGRFVQDFAQGGIGGVLNNIEGLVTALGMGSGLAGVLTIVGVAAALAGPKMLEWGRSLLEVRHGVPPLTDNLKYMEESIKANNKAIEELRSQTSLSGTELERLNRLTAENAVLEKAAAEEKKRRQEIEKYDNLKSDQEREDASAFTQAIQEGGAGESAQLKERIRKALESKNEQEIKEQERRTERRIVDENMSTDEMAKAYKELDEYRKFKRQDQTGLANDLVVGAMQGNATDISSIENLFNGGYGVSSGGFMDRFRNHRGAKERKKNADEAKKRYEAEQKRLDEQDKEEERKKAELDRRLENAGAVDDEERARQERAGKAERDTTRHHIKAQVKEEDEFADRSGLVTEAAYMQAAHVAEGKSGGAAYDLTHRYVQQQLQRRYGMGEEEAWGRAHRIAGSARAQDEKGYEQAYAQAIHAGANVNQAVIYANQQLLTTMAAAMRQLQTQAQQLRQQGARASSLRVRNASFAPPGGGEG